jgi:hypothetical protein
MKEAIVRLATLVGTPVRSWGRCDIAGLIPNHVPLHPVVAAYFENYAPSVGIDLFEYQFCAGGEIRSTNREDSPGREINPHGFIVFGLTPCGDGIVFDARDAAVFVVSHERFSDDGIFQGWNESRTAFLPELPINPANIRHTAEERFESLPVFLAHCERRATEVVEKRRRFEHAVRLDPNATDEAGHSALTHAILAWDETKVASLIARGADVNQRDRDGRTPLFYACGAPRLCRRLIQAGADVNARNHDLQSPLMEAVRLSNDACIQLMLKAGADPLARDQGGRSPLDFICPVHGTSRIKRLLRRAAGRR